MNPYYSGLGIARSLRARGVALIALSSEPDAPGAKSRYFDRVHIVPNGRDEPDALFRRLTEIAREHRVRPVIFPTRDFDILFLHEYREALNPFLSLPQPQESSILRMMDKLELARFASGIEIPAPVTVTCVSAEDLERQMQALRFPVIMKPRFAYQWRRKGQWERVGAQKAIIAETAVEALSSYRRVADVTQEVILQEYVPGEDSEIVVCCCYMDKQQELKGHFTARKLQQVPALTGTGTVVEAIDVAPIVPTSVRLLKAFGYSGLAEIEYKHDRRTDTYVLIEINPRHWDQHELGSLVGVNLSWLAYADMIGAQLSQCAPNYGVGIRHKWVAEAELAQGSVRKIWGELQMPADTAGSFKRRASTIARNVGELNELLSGRKIFGMSSFGDPLPGILTWLRLGAGGLASLWNLLAGKRRADGSGYRPAQ